MTRDRVREHHERFDFRSRHVARDLYRGNARESRAHVNAVNDALRRIEREVERDGGRIIDRISGKQIEALAKDLIWQAGRGRRLTERQLQDIAEELSLTPSHVRNGELHYPDYQLWIENKYKEVYPANVDGTTVNYRRAHLQAKARAGFIMYGKTRGLFAQRHMGGRKIWEGPNLTGKILGGTGFQRNPGVKAVPGRSMGL